jgi:hypothetical protein
MNNSNVTDWGKVKQLFEIEVSKLFGRNKTIEVIPEHFYDLFDKIQMYGSKFSAKSYSMTVTRLSCTYYVDGSANFGEGKSYSSNVYFTNPDAEFQLMVEQLSSDEFCSTYRHHYLDMCDEPGDNYAEKTFTRASIPVADFELYTGCIIKDGNNIVSEYHLSDEMIEKMKIKYGGFTIIPTDTATVDDIESDTESIDTDFDKTPNIELPKVLHVTRPTTSGYYEVIRNKDQTSIVGFSRLDEKTITRFHNSENMSGLYIQHFDDPSICRMFRAEDIFIVN